MSYSVINLNKFKNQVSKINSCKIEVDENLLHEAKEEQTTPNYLVYYLLKKQIYLIAKDIWKVIGCNLYLKRCGEDYYSFFKIEEDNLKLLMPSEARQIYFDFLNSLEINIFGDGKINFNRDIPSIKEFPVKYLFNCRNWFNTNFLMGAYQVFKNDLLNRSIYKYLSYGGIVYYIYNDKFQAHCMDNRKVNVQMVYDYLYGDIKDFEEKYKNEIWYWQSPINTFRRENENPANFVDRIK